MKKRILFFVCSILHLNILFSTNFQVIPKHPQAGETFTIEYDPSGTELEDQEVFVIAYVLELGQSPKAHDLVMTKSDKGYTTNFKPPVNTQAVFFKFLNEDGKKVDTNNDEGYYTLIYKKDKPVKHAYVIASTIYAGNADLFGIKLNASKAAETFEMGITNPSERISTDYLNYYAIVVRITDEEKGKAEILEHLNSTLAKGNLSEKEMKSLASIAQRVKEKDLYMSIIEKLKIKFPEGTQAVSTKYASFRKLENFEEQIAMYEEAYSKYNNNKSLEMMLDNMERRIANSYGEKGDFKNMYKYAERLSGIKSHASIYNKYAWQCSGGSIEGEGHRIQEGLEMSMKSLQLIEYDMKTLDDKLVAYSERQWTQGLKNYYGSYSDTYALLAYKKGDLESALKYQKIACETNKMSDAEMNARYAFFIEKGKGEKEAMTFLENMIATGKANDDMKQNFARLFKTNVSIEKASKMYLTKLEEKANDFKAKKIKEEMINKKAPNFSLKNLQGDQVSLESLKGKVVVVDFWATWCGPCKASFPAMQKAVTKYEKSDDVEFVFIDTWERSDKKEEGAQNFINEKGYTFNVLMDNDNKTVSDFGVSGIPAKFILDKKGNIRLKGSGFNGNDETLVEEISIVVEILRSE